MRTISIDMILAQYLCGPDMKRNPTEGIDHEAGTDEYRGCRMLHYSFAVSGSCCKKSNSWILFRLPGFRDIEIEDVP